MELYCSRGLLASYNRESHSSVHHKKLMFVFVSLCSCGEHFNPFGRQHGGSGDSERVQSNLHPREGTIPCTPVNFSLCICGTAYLFPPTVDAKFSNTVYERTSIMRYYFLRFIMLCNTSLYPAVVNGYLYSILSVVLPVCLILMCVCSACR